jgi:hypothetical protein
MPDYEIIVFENHEIYDLTTASELTVVSTYLDYCKQYVNPEYVEETQTNLYNTKMMISYTDKSGSDKPCNVLLIGRISSELFEEIRKGLAKFYDTPKATPIFMGH